MSCSCSASKTTLIYSCSGAADVGEIADRTARSLARSGVGKMSCGVGVAGGVAALRNAALTADKVVAIDGCATGCLAKAFSEAGVERVQHLDLGTLGFAKGASPADAANLDRALQAVRERIGAAA